MLRSHFEAGACNADFLAPSLTPLPLALPLTHHVHTMPQDPFERPGMAFVAKKLKELSQDAGVMAELEACVPPPPEPEPEEEEEVGVGRVWEV